MADGFSTPRERIEAHPTFMDYCAAQTTDGLARLVWDQAHQRNAFGSYPGTVHDHALTIIAAARREGADRIVALEAENAQLKADAWQPIASAPKDGTIVDLWVSHPDRAGGGYRETNVKWDGEAWVYGYRWTNFVEGFFTDAGVPLIRATHWMPLPAPPVLATAIRALAQEDKT